MTLDMDRPYLGSNGGSSSPVVRSAPAVWRAASAEPMFAVDEHDRVKLWNEAATELLGYGPDEVLGRKCWEVVRGLTKERRALCGNECTVRRCAARGELPHAYDILCPVKDGRLLWLESRVLVVEDGAGRMLLHVLRYVGEERRLAAYAREVLERSSAVLGLSAGEEKPAAVSPLSARELEVLRLLDEGKRPTDIAKTLNITQRTARNHVQSIIGKLNVHSALEAVAASRRQRLI